MKIVNRQGQIVTLTKKEIKELTPAQRKEIIINSTEVRFTKTKKGKRGLAVFDRITGKRLKFSKFNKEVGITKAAYSYLKTKEFENNVRALENTRIKNVVGQFIKELIRTSEFERLVDIRLVPDFLTGYKNFYWNEELKTKTEIREELFNLEEKLNSYDPGPFLIKIKIWYENENVRIYYRGGLEKFLKKVEGYEVADLKEKSFTDKQGNFILLSS